jgi:hypothetical protein
MLMGPKEEEEEESTSIFTLYSMLFHSKEDQMRIHFSR